MQLIYFLALSAFFGTIAISLLAPIEALYLQNLSGSYGGIGITMSISSLAFLLFSPIIGRISDIVGRKKIILSLSFIGVFIPLLLVTSKNIYQYSFFKFVAGITMCATITVFALIGDMVEKSKRKGLVFGLYIMGGSIGGAIGSLIGGALASFVGSLRTPYFISFIFSLLSFAFLLFILKYPEMNEKLSVKEHVPNLFNLKLLKVLTLPLIAVLMMKFVFMFHMSMKGVMWPYLISNFVNKKVAPFYTAVTFASMGLLAGFLSPLVGKLSDRYGHMRFFFLGWFMMGVVGLSFYFVNSFIFIFSLSLFYAFGEILKGPAANAILTKYSSRRNRGFIYGLVASVSSLASFAGLSVTGILMDVIRWNIILLIYGLMILLPALVSYITLRKREYL